MPNLQRLMMEKERAVTTAAILPPPPERVLFWRKEEVAKVREEMLLKMEGREMRGLMEGRRTVPRNRQRKKEMVTGSLLPGMEEERPMIRVPSPRILGVSLLLTVRQRALRIHPLPAGSKGHLRRMETAWMVSLQRQHPI